MQIEEILQEIYDGEIVKACCDTIVNVYLVKFEEFQKRVEQLLSEENY